MTFKRLAEWSVIGFIIGGFLGASIAIEVAGEKVEGLLVVAVLATIGYLTLFFIVND